MAGHPKRRVGWPAKEGRSSRTNNVRREKFAD